MSEKILGVRISRFLMVFVTAPRASSYVDRRAVSRSFRHIWLPLGQACLLAVSHKAAPADDAPAKRDS
jgi:hypothetical protein